MLNGRALAYLCEVQRRGSLRGAAIHLNVDVSAISRLIRRQEEELSIPLLTRHPDGVTLTEAGRLLVEHHRARCDAETATLSRLSALQSLDSGEVRVAVGEGFIADLVNAPLQTFMTAHAGIDIVVVMAGVNEAMALVRDREVDLALLYAPPMDPLLRCHVERRHPLDLIGACRPSTDSAPGTIDPGRNQRLATGADGQPLWHAPDGRPGRPSGAPPSAFTAAYQLGHRPEEFRQVR